MSIENSVGAKADVLGVALGLSSVQLNLRDEPISYIERTLSYLSK